jgi:hypothetical protein
MATIQPENLADEVQKLLDEYGDVVNDALKEAIEETAKEAQQQLRSKNMGRKLWKKYPKGWSVQIKAGRLDVEGIVYNKDHYRLTHLLEFGHATRNGGRTKAFPHIADVNAFAQKEVLERLKEKLEK